MSDIFGTDHFDEEPVSAGPSVGFFEGLSQGYEQQYRVDSPYSLDQELKDAWADSVRQYEVLTGDSANLPVPLEAYSAYARQVQGKPQSFWHTNPFTGDTSQTTQDEIASFARLNDKIKKLGNPNIKPFEQVLNEVVKMQQGVDQTSAIDAQQATLGGTIGQFIGGVAGSISGRDPINLATLGLGGVGKTVALRIATEMGINAAITGVTDAGSVNPDRALAGLEEHNTLYDMATSAVGAGAITGLGEVASRAFGKYFGGNVDVQPHDFTPLRTALEEAAPTSPRARAGLEFLDNADHFQAINPYGHSEEADARFIAELQGVAEVLSGKPQTAITRVLPPIPFEAIERNANFELVKQEVPEVYTRWQDAKNKVAIATSELEHIAEAHILLIHGGSRFDAIDPTRFGSGEPGNIRPLGNGLYGYVARSDDPASIQAAVAGARHYAEKYGRGEKAIHVFSADTGSSQVGFNGAIVDWIKRASVPEKFQKVLDAYDEANVLSPGPERTAAFDRARALDEQAGKQPFDFRAEQLPGGLVEMAAFNPNKLDRIFEAGLFHSDEEIADIIGQRSPETLEQMLREGNEEIRLAAEEMSKEIERLQRQRAALRGIVQAQAVATAAPEARFIIAPLIQHEAVAARVERINQLVEAQPALAERIVSESGPSTVKEEPGVVQKVLDTLRGHKDAEVPDTIDIGLPEPVAKDFIFAAEMPDGTMREMTIEDAMRDLREDMALDEAVRTCAL